MKKRAALLAMATIMALSPIASFAATDNGVNKVVKVTKDAELTENVPVLKIENDDNHMEASDTIVLELENAEWLENDDETFTDNSETLESTIEAGVVAAMGLTPADVEVRRSTDKKIEIKYSNYDVTTTGTIIEVPMYVELQGEGEAKVSVSSKSGVLTEDSHTFAVGADGEVMVELDDTITFSNNDVIPTVTISENIAGAVDVSELSNEYITLTVDEDFVLGVTGAYVTGDFVGGKVLLDNTNSKLDDNELKIYFEGGKSGTFPTGITNPIQLNASEEVRRDFEIVGVTIEASSKADEGDLELKVKSSISEIKDKTFELGTFAEYDVTVEADGDALEIYSGRYDDDDDTEIQTLIIKEEVSGALQQDRYVNVELPSWVRIKAVEIDGSVVTNGIDENEFEFKPSDYTTSGDDVDMEVKFFVTVEAGKTGDITAKIDGRAFDDEDYEIVLGKAIAPVTVEAEVAPIKAGVRNQEIGKITLTETADEAFQKDKWVIVELSDDDIEWDGEPTIEVVKGDLEIDEDSIEVDYNNLGKHVVAFQIKEESSEASVIEITNGEVELDRAISQGAIEVEVKGDALVENYDENDDTKFDQDTYATIEVANVTTADTIEEAKFVIGSSEYMVGNETRTADVAPYIKDGRTMLPVRYVAESLGVEENNIMWDGNTRTVTIFKGDRIAQIKIGSDKLLVNGTTITMDTVAEIKDGRTMLPVSFIAKALGADVEWDGATRTVTIK